MISEDEQYEYDCREEAERYLEDQRQYEEFMQELHNATTFLKNNKCIVLDETTSAGILTTLKHASSQCKFLYEANPKTTLAIDLQGWIENIIEIMEK